VNELVALVASAEELRRAAEPFLLATVVGVRGSSYRRPGARMLLTRDRWIAGSVSGGCLESDLVKKGWWRTTEGPRIVTYDAAARDDLGWGLGLGCDGVVDVLIERVDDRNLDPLAVIAGCLEGQSPAAVATVIGGAEAPIGQRVVLSRDGSMRSDVSGAPLVRALLAECEAALARREAHMATCTGGIEALVETIRPPPRLFVLGAGHDAVPVVEIARAAGWEPIVWEPFARFATRERFAGAAATTAGPLAKLTARVDASDRPFAVVMAHDYAGDRAALEALLRTRALYVGMLGPRKRTERMLRELALSGDPRIHAPVGLALGAESPQEIALAIVAEAQAVLARADGASLREHAGSIHAASAAE
jgi:xanthine dehydrogenase accessory factor